MSRDFTQESNDFLIGYLTTVAAILDELNRPTFAAAVREGVRRLEESQPHVPTEAEWRDLGRPTDYGEQ